mgnify:CR=1 FL=1
MNVMRPPKLALIAGPTASGKSALAMALAKSLIAADRQALIVNADASQVYADIPILSAAPSAAERAEVPHALVGHVDAGVNVNAAMWAAQARDAIMTALAEGVVPILVGGTGMYIKTLIDGIAPVPAIDPDVRAMVRALPPAEAHVRLVPLDPAAAAKLPPGDRTRVQRALEVVLSSGRTLGEWQRETTGGLREAVTLVPMLLLPPRDWLKARCDRRLDVMMAAGALAEVRALLARGLNPDLPAMRAIGVPELAAHLSGEWSLDQAVERAKIATRQYAKRQYTWLRGQLPEDWPREERALNDENINEIAIKLRQRLLTD